MSAVSTSYNQWVAPPILIMIRVGQQPIQDHRGDHRISKDRRGGFRTLVPGEDNLPLLITLGGELEEEFGALPNTRNV